jgi:adenine-specific DNA methylase
VWLDDLYLYNMPRWCDLFNPRQLLSLCTFGKWVREAYRQVLRESGDAEFAKAVATYLALAVDFMANLPVCASSWDNARTGAKQLFGSPLPHGLGLRRDQPSQRCHLAAWEQH